MKFVTFLLISIFEIINADSAGCENHAVAQNIAENGRKFHLKDMRTNQYLIVEANTKVLRTVTLEEFEHAKQNEITWFTACNEFTQVFGDSANHFEICMAGVENQRLYYNQIYAFFMFMKPQLRSAISIPYLPMNLRLVLNGRTNSIEQASLFCTRGHLEFKRNLIRIGSVQSFLSVEDEE